MRVSKKYLVVSVFVVAAVAGAFLIGVDAGFEARLKAARIAELFADINSSQYLPESLNPARNKASEGGGDESHVNRDLFGVDVRVPDVDFSPFLQAWYLIDEKYDFEDRPTEQEKLWGAISGLAESVGDPYTVFLPPDAASIFEEDIQGSFGGVGIEIGMRDGLPTVISPLEGTPGDRAGLRPDDKIIEVDGTPTENLTLEEVIILIRGDVGDPVTLTIFRREAESDRGGRTFDVKIIRDKISIPTIETRTQDGVFIIKLYSFTANSGPLFHNALIEFRNTGLDKLVIDLRNNPGGFLQAAINIASFFVPEGKPIVIEDRGLNEEDKIDRSHGYVFFDDMPEIAVLVNRGSASASEIFAAALSEHGLATVVGEQTFGKGSVQELVSLTEDTRLKITTGKWKTPNGISIEEEGITPDVVVEAGEGGEAERDPILERAIEILNE